MTAESTTATTEAASGETGETPGTTTETTTGDGQGTGTAASAATTDQGATGGDDPASWDKDRAAATIKSQRVAEQAAIARATAAEAKLAEIEREKLSEEERKTADLTAATNRAETAERTIRELTITATFRDAAIEAGIQPKAIAAARALVELQVDDDGTVTNLADAIEQLKAEHEYLLVPGSGQRKARPREGSSNAGSGGSDGSDAGATLTSTELDIAARAGISPETYAKHKSS